jgi:hypothetical protein
VTILKSIVICLALANVGYFLWVRGIAQAPSAADASAPQTTLRLVSEAPAGANAAPAAGHAVPAGDGGGATGGLVGTSSGADGGSSGAADYEGAPSSVNGAGLLTTVKRCISVGPFRDVAEAAHAASTLRGGGYDPRQRVAEGEVWAGVWVYLPIAASRSSEQMLVKLKAGGIEDALEMPGPNEGSVISLGLYGDSKRAQTRVAQAQSLGFNPALADRKRTGDVYWLDIDLKPTDSVLKPTDLRGEAGRIVRLEVKGCPAAGGAS